MPSWPKPHSPEWFKTLDKFNSDQAAHTRQILKAAGRDDVCSVCGDEPAADYKIIAPTPHERSVATIRLCNDCRLIREMKGESYLPLRQK